MKRAAEVDRRRKREDLPGRPEAIRRLVETRAEGEEMTTGANMTESDEIELLGEIAAQGGRRYTRGNVDRTKYERLVKAGWLKPFCPNISDVVYEVTDAGRAALGKLGT